MNRVKLTKESVALVFGNMEYIPESMTLPVTVANGKPLPEVKPIYRHARSPEEYHAMLADKTDLRPIKIFFPVKEQS